MKAKSFAGILATAAALSLLATGAIAQTVIYSNDFAGADLTANGFTQTSNLGAGVWGIASAAGQQPTGGSLGNYMTFQPGSGETCSDWAIGPTAGFTITAGNVYTVSYRRRLGSVGRAYRVYIGTGTTPNDFLTGGELLVQVEAAASSDALVSQSFRATSSGTMRLAFWDASASSTSTTRFHSIDDISVTEFPADTPVLTVNTVRVAEGSNVDFTVTSDIVPTTPITFNWAAQNGFTNVATNGTHWSGALSGSGTPITAPATTSTVSFGTTPAAGLSVERNFFFSINTVAGGGATTDARVRIGSGYGVIQNADAYPTATGDAILLNTFGTFGTAMGRTTTPADPGASAPISYGGRPIRINLNTSTISPSYNALEGPAFSGRVGDFAGTNTSEIYWADSSVGSVTGTDYLYRQRLWKHNLTTTEPTLVGVLLLDPGTTTVTGIKWSHTENVFKLIAVNPVSLLQSLYNVTPGGLVTKVGDITGGGFTPTTNLINGFCVDWPSGNIYAFDTATDQTWVINPATAAASVLGSFGASATADNFSGDAAVDTSTGTMYYSINDTTLSQWYWNSVDKVTGALTKISDVEALQGLGQLQLVAFRNNVGAGVHEWSAF